MTLPVLLTNWKLASHYKTSAILTLFIDLRNTISATVFEVLYNSGYVLNLYRLSHSLKRFFSRSRNEYNLMAYISIWIEAARLRTLPAAVVPVLTGAALAWNHGGFHTGVTFAAIGCALLIQVATNFANDYFDYVKGADNDDRVGFTRASSSGLISPDMMLKAAILTFGLAFLLGLYLVWVGGWIILLIGVASILSGLAYTGGPFPLAYNGLGDLFVFIFFGIIAVTGTYYVNVLEWSYEAFVISLAIGALATNILVVNNLRDVETDARSNKNTLGVLFGERFLKTEYALMLVLAYAIPLWLLLSGDYSGWVLLPFISLPVALLLYRSLLTISDKSLLNPHLGRTAQLMALFGILLSAGIVIG